MVELTTQTIGMIAGVLVFSATVVTTFILLVLGGSFKRMREQADMYQGTGPAALKQALKPRPELYEELLEAARTLPVVPASPAEGKNGLAGELRGHHVILRTLRDGDIDGIFEACNGLPKMGLAYDPDLEIWNMTPHGPFSIKEELASSPLMQPLSDGLRFIVIDRVTFNTIGMAAIVANTPSSLRAEIGDVWLNPAYRDKPALHEVHYLLLDHLFGMGYRRVERRVDSADGKARIDLPTAGFHLEGVLRKHMIVKGSNRDTAMFAMVNSDWRDKAKAGLEKILEPDSNTAQAEMSRREKAKAKAQAEALAAAATRQLMTSSFVGEQITAEAGGSGAESKQDA